MMFNFRPPLIDGRLAFMNRKRVFVPQKIVPKIVAELLVLPAASTAYEGNHPETVDSIPDVKKSEKLSIITILFEASLDYYVLFSSFSLLSFPLS